MTESTTSPTRIKALFKNALTDKINDREMFMKGADYSYYYEQETDHINESELEADATRSNTSENITFSKPFFARNPAPVPWDSIAAQRRGNF